MKTRLLTLALALLTAINVLANVNVRTNRSPVQPGTVLHLSWQRPSPTQLSDVDVSYDGGSTWEEIAAGLEQDTLLWKIPAVKFEEVRFRVRTQKEIRTEREFGEILPRDNVTRARGFSRDGTTMYAIESYAKSCRVLRTDVSTLKTECLWRDSASTAWGKISPNLQYAVLSTNSGNVVVVDLHTGAAHQRAMRVHDFDFLRDGAQFAAILGGDVLSMYETSTLTQIARWQLAKSYQAPQLFAFEDRCFVRYGGKRTLVFKATDTVGNDCGSEISEVAYGWGYDVGTQQLISLSTMSGFEELGSGVVLMSTSNDGRYGVLRSQLSYLRTICVVDKLHKTVRWATLKENPQQCPVMVTDDGAHVLQQDREGTAIYRLASNGATLIANVDTPISALTPDGALLAFLDGAAFVYDLDGKLLQHKINLYTAPISISDNGEYALSFVGSKIVIVNTKTSDHFPVMSVSGISTSIRWSLDGKEAALLHGNELRVIDLEKRTSRLVAESGITDLLNCYLVATPNLEILVPIWNGRRAMIVKTDDGAPTVVVNNSLYYSVIDCRIDSKARRVYFSARLVNEFSPWTIVYSDIDNPHYVRPFNYVASRAMTPSNIFKFAVNETAGYLLTLQQLNESNTRMSAWKHSGVLVWTKDYNLSLNELKGVCFMSDAQDLVLSYAEKTYVFNAMTGNEDHSGTTYLLGEALGGRAYLSRHKSVQDSASVQIHLCAQTLSEFIPLPDVVRDRWSIQYSQNTLIYKTDSTWKLVRNPAAEFDEASTMYSEPLQRSIVTSVRMIDHNVQIEAETSGYSVSTSLVMFDLQGRMLGEHNDVDLRSCSTDVFVGGEQLPRQVAVQIFHQEQLLFSGVLFR